jgi:hypothetical protein
MIIPTRELDAIKLPENNKGFRKRMINHKQTRETITSMSEQKTRINGRGDDEGGVKKRTRKKKTMPVSPVVSPVVSPKPVSPKPVSPKPVPPKPVPPMHATTAITIAAGLGLGGGTGIGGHYHHHHHQHPPPPPRQTVPIIITDDTQHQHECFQSVINYTCEPGTYLCYWCKHPVINMLHSTGCPSTFKPRTIEKQCKSITPRILQPVPQVPNRLRLDEAASTTTTTLAAMSPGSIHINEHVTDVESAASTAAGSATAAVFYTDGIFCDFPCCKAWIDDDATIDASERVIKNILLHTIFIKRYKMNKLIYPAPHWRLLKIFGGHLGIDQFRSYSTHKRFTFYGSTQIHQISTGSEDYPSQFVPISRLYEEQIQF